ncbi:hypothetical protein [Rhodococcus sp. NPDC055024]
MPVALALAAATTLGALALIPTAEATPSPQRTAVDASSWRALCTPTDEGLEELSGLTVAGGNMYAIGDSNSDDRVAELDAHCRVRRWIPVPVPRVDVEDLAATTDGTLWLADIGDNKAKRSTVALIPMTPAGVTSGARRLSYPDGAHNAEALLLTRAETPIIVTKDFSGTAGIYTPADALTTSELAVNTVTALRKVGSVTIAPTATPGGYKGTEGSKAVTGGAVSADGTVAALRTYSDVYLYSAPDGDIASAFTRTTPVHVPLPNQPQGEAIAFTPEGDLISGSEANGGALPPLFVLRGATTLAHSGVGAVGSLDRIPAPFGS